MQGPEWKIIGNAEDEEKEKLKKIPQEIIEGNPLAVYSPEKAELIRTSELEKSPEEEQLIDIANAVSNQFMEAAGVASYDIPAKNIHFLPKSAFTVLRGEETIAVAFAPTADQNIFVNADTVRKINDKIYLTTTYVHELLHVKAHITAELHLSTDSEGKEVETHNVYRYGVETFEPVSEWLKHEGDESRGYFSGLHEAIVSDLEKKSLAILLQMPEFKVEKEWLESDEVKNIKNRIREEIEYEYEDEEISYVSRDDKKVEFFPYAEFRNVYDYVCIEICLALPEQFVDIESVKKEFIKAHFSGRLLELGRIMKQTFGESGLRILGSMKDEESAQNVLKLLKQARRNSKNA